MDSINNNYYDYLNFILNFDTNIFLKTYILNESIDSNNLY